MPLSLPLTYQLLLSGTASGFLEVPDGVRTVFTTTAKFSVPHISVSKNKVKQRLTLDQNREDGFQILSDQRIQFNFPPLAALPGQNEDLLECLFVLETMGGDIPASLNEWTVLGNETEVQSAMKYESGRILAYLNGVFLCPNLEVLFTPPLLAKILVKVLPGDEVGLEYKVWEGY